MKAILLCFLVSGCAIQEERFVLTREQLGDAVGKAWLHGYGRGFDDGADLKDRQKVKPL